jgi:TCP-1/cpn60 chaperonin family
MLRCAVLLIAHHMRRVRRWSTETLRTLTTSDIRSCALVWRFRAYGSAQRLARSVQGVLIISDAGHPLTLRVCACVQAAQKTNDAAGDGTTTATVLSAALIAEGMKVVAAGANPVQVTRGMDRVVKELVLKLQAMSQVRRRCPLQPHHVGARHGSCPRGGGEGVSCRLEDEVSPELSPLVLFSTPSLTCVA